MQMLSTSRKAASVKVGHPPIYGNQVGIWRGGVAWRRVAGGGATKCGGGGDNANGNELARLYLIDFPGRQ
mgnify:CR=1 FL=1